MIKGGETIAASLIEHGLIPSAPYHPNVAFATWAVELFCTAHLQCPHLTIQPFVKSLCNLHGIPFKLYLSKQFSIAYDVYLSILSKTKKHIQTVLKRNMLKWQLCNACPSCTYKLEGEKDMIFEMLVTMDGNDFLKRVICHEPMAEDEDGELIPGRSKERLDDCDVGGDYYLSWEMVDEWAKGVLQEMLPTGKVSEEGTEDSESNPCGEQWKNMIDELTAHMWGIFDETGIFLTLCRHGFSIQEYAMHMDKYETYTNLSTFLVNNYYQTLRLINGLPALEKQMNDQEVPDFETFKQWLVEEKAYLEGLSGEPLQETLQMEYYQRLVNLDASQKALDQAQAKWLVITPENHNVRDYTWSTKRERRHALENYEKDLKVVQGLKTKLGIKTQWTQRNPDWKVAVEMVAKRCYQRCLDHLEQLVVSRMFELTKMNLSKMGYKLHKHIGKALKAQSQAIQSVLKKYNLAAQVLSLPRPELLWDLIVEYAFLVDFDLLSDTHQDVRERPWAAPATQAMMDKYFKIQHAREEIEMMMMMATMATTTTMPCWLNKYTR
ncbi:hypothetical protein C0992_011685 [Termitomyces sp. T32_za158]|nr:hypothetical protein C0992_011685 [Termitomyces sp. T32_za158]